MKKISLILLLLFFASDCFARGGGALPPVCSASAPSQATSAGYSNLVFCDTLSNQQTIDTQNTGNAGYNWYPIGTKAGYKNTVALTPAEILNDGTGSYTLPPTGTNPAGEIATAAPSGNTAGYVGTTFTPGFYMEVQMKWVTSGGGCTNKWPVFWLSSELYLISNFTYPQVEIDVFEFNGCSTSPQANLYSWLSGTPTATAGWGNSNNSPSMGSPTYSNYNTYGILWIPASQGGGTGTISWYFNNTLKETITYSASGTPTPSTCRGGVGLSPFSGSNTCGTGAFSGMDTTPVFIYLSTNNPSGAAEHATYKDFHVWQ